MAPNSWQFPVQRPWRSSLVGSVLVLGGVLSSAMASLMAAPIAQATPPDRFLSGSGEETNAGILAVPHLGLGDMALAPGEASSASGTDRRGDRPSTPNPIAPTIAEVETPALDPNLEPNLDPNNGTPRCAPPASPSPRPWHPREP